MISCTSNTIPSCIKKVWAITMTWKVTNVAVNCQIILLLLGRIHQEDGRFLSTVTKSSAYLSGISHHLAASSVRSRFLGMVLGSAVSERIDEPDKRLKFTAEHFDGEEWDWYKGLLSMHDHIGSIADLHSETKKSDIIIKNQARESIRNGNSRPQPASAATSKIVAIEEISDGSDSDDDDLPTYAKPDSDPSDDDEDPTLVQRNKPTAPVYIRDLVSGLLDTEDYDKHTLALKTAPSLIRRKAGFGTEVQDLLVDLATTIVGMKDRWELPDFIRLRLQGILAVLVSDPKQMGPWYSYAFYSGDYSLSQRGAILTSVGLGAREIAGLDKDDAALTGADSSKDTFPSKALPSKLHEYYASDTSPTNLLATQLSRTMIQPLAADAADKASGPNALKVRTFSSRMDVERKRTKPTANPLAKIVAEAFFFPLIGRWQIHTQAIGENAPQASPMLLSQLLKTLSLVLHAAGSATLMLPQLTGEFWGFLLALRVKGNDKSVLEALLFAFLTLLDVNGENHRSLAMEHAKELLETQQWVGDVLERIGGGEKEGERCRMLAGGVLVRCREVVEKYQRLLMGDMIGYET